MLLLSSIIYWIAEHLRTPEEVLKAFWGDEEDDEA